MSEREPLLGAQQQPAIDFYSASGFGITLSQLVRLVSDRGQAGVEILNSKYGGVQGLSRRLKVSLELGLTTTEQDDVQKRRHFFGANRIPVAPSTSIWTLMWAAAKDPTLLIMIIAAVVSLVFGTALTPLDELEWIEGIAILVSVALVILVSSINDYQKEKQFRALEAKQDEQKFVDVIRNGEAIRLSSFDLVVGDLIQFSPGQVLPADGVMIRGSDVACDESALTGESDEMKKSSDRKPFMLSGTSVMKGTGVMMVLCVGLFSEEGIIQKLITGVGEQETTRLELLDANVIRSVQDFSESMEAQFQALPPEKKEKFENQESKKKSKKESMLMLKLTRLAMQIGLLGIPAGLLCFIGLCVRFAIEEFAIHHLPWTREYWNDIIAFFIIGVTVLVVAVPEGLPLAVTISLAYSVKKMMKDNNLVRVLAACETMGNATSICCDKTGTLTTNRMSVERVFINKTDFEDVRGVRILDRQFLEPVAMAIAINSEPKSVYLQQPDSLPLQFGNKTECACLQFSDQMFDQKYDHFRRLYPESSFVQVFPFSSLKKRMSTIVRLPDKKFRLFVKGAPDFLLPLCVSELSVNGVELLTPQRMDEIQKSVIERYGEKALRVILFAFRDFESEAECLQDEDIVVRDLTIQFFVGIQDPLRKEATEAVTMCKKAGVTVRMLTGDNVITARAIAINCGILNSSEEALVMEGPEFRRQVLRADGTINYAVFKDIAPKLRVMARCSPTDKFNLVRGLMKLGEVVAVTGDGTNDGPALAEADVGFAMGLSGTGVAREASDIIITDDNFMSIVKAISWGRNVYDSVSKFLQFQLTVNVSAITIAVVSVFAINDSPLRAVQMLWVSMIMDSFASLALATEAPSPDLLKRKPYGRGEALISKIMMRNIIGQSIYQLAVIFFLIFYGDTMFGIPSGRDKEFTDGPTQHFTLVFNVFVWMQIFNEICSRRVHDELDIWTGFFGNKMFLAIVFFTAVAQYVIVQYSGDIFKVKALDLDQWLASLAFGLGSLIWYPIIHFLFPYRFIPNSILPGRTKLTKLDIGNAGVKEEERRLEDSLSPASHTPHAMIVRHAQPLSDIRSAARIEPLAPGRMFLKRTMNRSQRSSNPQRRRASILASLHSSASMSKISKLQKKNRQSFSMERQTQFAEEDHDTSTNPAESTV